MPGVNTIAAPELDVDELAKQLASGRALTLLDVREPDETVAGCIADALLIPRAALVRRIANDVPDKSKPLIVYCASGVRSALATRTLIEMGYADVRSLRGGFTAWQRAGQSWVVPAQLTSALLDPDQLQRYARQLRLPEVGMAGQRKLLDARILCIGAGGLGSPALLYLAAAGVGTLGVIDDDAVELSNLHRQVLHNSERVGHSKVSSAQLTLAALNADTRVNAIRARLTAQNAEALVGDYDVIVDGSDNFATRYLLNDVAICLGLPVVHASIYRYEGQLTVFSASGAPCYRCVFPAPPTAEQSPSCQDAGVLGVLPGVMGVLQATEALKLVLGIGETLVGRLLLYDALSMRFSELQLSRDRNCPACGANAAPHAAAAV